MDKRDLRGSAAMARVRKMLHSRGAMEEEAAVHMSEGYHFGGDSDPDDDFKARICAELFQQFRHPEL